MLHVIDNINKLHFNNNQSSCKSQKQGLCVFSLLVMTFQVVIIYITLYLTKLINNNRIPSTKDCTINLRCIEIFFMILLFKIVRPFLWIFLFLSALQYSPFNMNINVRLSGSLVEKKP